MEGEWLAVFIFTVEIKEYKRDCVEQQVDNKPGKYYHVNESLSSSATATHLHF